jgi:transposase InsO family protein
LVSYGGGKYVATFIDHATDYSLVKIVKKKSDVAAIIIDTLTYMETQAGTKVKAIRTDNGLEYVNNTLHSYLASKGIEAQTTMAYTPQQNGKAERLNRTLVNKAIPMLVASGLPQEAWAEAMVTANHLRNISPTTNHNSVKDCPPTPPHLRHPTPPRR